MSCRELRNFTEMMRSLGYERLISMENFRNPNFPLVAEILVWLVKRFDPNVSIPKEYDTEEKRIALIRAAVQFMASEAKIKLNPKLLYQADGYAVRELLKATTILYTALHANNNEVSEDFSDSFTPADISGKIEDLKRARQLSSEITSNGAQVYDILGKEADFRELRNISANRQLETEDVRAALQEAIRALREENVNTKQLIDNVKASEQTLDAKIEKRRLELDRNQKRLQTLKKVRPAFLDEYERLEVEFRKLYEDYMVRFRSLVYLEQQNEESEQVEQERMEERQAATQKQLEQMKKEDRFQLSPDDLFAATEIKEEAEDVATKIPTGKASRVRIKTASGGMSTQPESSSEKMMRKASASTSHHRQVFGSMNGPEDDDSGSLDSDSDILLDGDNSELLGTEDEEELSLAGGKPRHSSQSKPHSDDDF